MRRALAIIGGALLGAAICYEIVAYVACTWLWPASNLCGLPAVAIGFPLGVAIGATLVWRATRRPLEAPGGAGTNGDRTDR